MNEQIKYLQILCNQLSIKDQNGNTLVEDGILGECSKYAFKNLPLLKIGSTGFKEKIAITHIQNVLGVTADGIFDQNTYNAVISFQISNELTADGIVGPNTWFVFASGLSDGKLTFVAKGVDLFVTIVKQEFTKGFSEHNRDNITPYGAWYGLNGQPWCAMFVSWCANKSNILNTVVPKYYYCSTGVELYKNMGRYKERSTGYIPMVGDVIFFQKDGGICHTGVVVSYDSKIVTTIEGNSQDAIMQHKYSLDDSYIHGYGANGGVK